MPTAWITRQNRSLCSGVCTDCVAPTVPDTTVHVVCYNTQRKKVRWRLHWRPNVLNAARRASERGATNRIGFSDTLPASGEHRASWNRWERVPTKARGCTKFRASILVDFA